MKNFKKTANAFNYIFEYEFTKTGDEEIIVKMPVVSANKRGFNDVGWQTDGDITLYGTLSSKPKDTNALWQKIRENEEINKTVSAIKIVKTGEPCRFVMRALLN